MTSWTKIDTPLGVMILAAQDDALIGAWFEGQRHFEGVQAAWKQDDRNTILLRAARQLREYFEGNRRQFDLPLAPRGTAFQKAVWGQIAQVACGRTSTYGQLAKRLSKPTAARAVGAATGRNPISIIVPCHRLLGQDGSLTGYAGGIERKRRLLDMEDAISPDSSA